MDPRTPHLDSRTVAADAALAELERLDRAAARVEAERAAVLRTLQAIGEAADRQQHGERAADLGYRSIRAEVALATRVSEQTAAVAMDRAVTLMTRFGQVYRAHRDGSISQAMAQAVCAPGGVVTDPAALEVFQERMLEYVAGGQSVNRVRARARQLAEQLAEVSLEERHRQAHRERRVTVMDAGDGMAELRALLAAPDAFALRELLTRTAHRVKAADHARLQERGSARARTRSDGGLDDAEKFRGLVAQLDDALPEERTMDQLRADALVEFVEQGALAHDVQAPADDDAAPAGRSVTRSAADEGRSDDFSKGIGLSPEDFAAPETRGGSDPVRARIQIVIPVMTLLSSAGWPTGPPGSAGDPAMDVAAGLGVSDPGRLAGMAGAEGPAILGGHGPIDGVSASGYAAAAGHWELVRVHPHSGEVLSTESYRPSRRLRRLVQARDQMCRFPGCRRVAEACDLDHTVQWRHGGATSADNLMTLCRGHHVLRHQTKWAYRQRPGGVAEWTSPTGRVFRDRPPSQVSFEPVEPETPAWERQWRELERRLRAEHGRHSRADDCADDRAEGETRESLGAGRDAWAAGDATHPF